MSHLPFADPHANRTLLPDDVAATAPTDSDPFEVAAEFPASSLAWAVLAELALANGTREGVLQAYAFARTGYHRGLDALRRNGWRGAGLVPWEHEPNQGFLRAVWALAQAARAIGETAEYDRCVQLLVDSSPTGYAELSGNTL
ncbi:MAG: DUF3151 domain-containing protein [Micropruina glycogenica]|jgi:hypothetical protein|uniref:DUF3151 domain-containing protein n=1 Tax=Micropruina glycogenica TaxID=75385 RepID=A0A2N9JCG0_9ACTN|nr:DUF3151 domain-containing protein [Micropruina glycogenica]MCB0890530.1 DUF3151 domain-containing protein [Propionibacteriaceae bacterium]SPD85209.1 conserved protein of unknown function [Micropruina glycogenica]